MPLPMRARRPISRPASARTVAARPVSSRLAAACVVTTAVMMMTLSRTPGLTASLRATITDVLVPVLSVVSAPVDAVRDVKAWIVEISTLRSENQALKLQVRQMSQWQTAAVELRTENDALRRLIHVVPQSQASYVAARIVSESGGPFVRSALINGGAQEGIAAGQAVVGSDGLVGRVVEAGASSARVLLLTDINSRVPVIGEVSRERSIAAGNNSAALTLDYVEPSSGLQVGERLLTSGDGGVFPPGIPVGIVTAIDGTHVTVQPLADRARMDYVSVVAYQL